MGRLFAETRPASRIAGFDGAKRGQSNLKGAKKWRKCSLEYKLLGFTTYE